MPKPVEVLIIDDEAIVCERLKEFLSAKGLYVEAFTESEKAVARMQERAFDVVVTDLKMSGPSGMDVLRLIREVLPSTTGILITAYGQFEKVREAEMLDAFEVVHKPFQLSEIHKLILKAAKQARKKVKLQAMAGPLEICIVDDEQIVCDRLQPVLEKNGFVVESFTDSKAAWERLSQKKFDILITDLKMTPPDGIELLKRARERFPEIRVVIITGFATVETARQAMKGGAADFIAKPFRLSQLRDLVLKIAKETQDATGSAK